MFPEKSAQRFLSFKMRKKNGIVHLSEVRTQFGFMTELTAHLTIWINLISCRVQTAESSATARSPYT